MGADHLPHWRETPIWFRNPNLSNPHRSSYLFFSTLAIGCYRSPPGNSNRPQALKISPARSRLNASKTCRGQVAQNMWVETAQKNRWWFCYLSFLQKNGAWRTCLLKTVAKYSKMMCQWTWPTVSNGPLMRSPLALKDTLLGWKKVDPFPHLWKPNSMFQNLKVQPIINTYHTLMVTFWLFGSTNGCLGGSATKNSIHRFWGKNNASMFILSDGPIAINPSRGWTHFCLLKFTIMYISVYIGYGVWSNLCTQRTMWIGWFCNIDPQNCPS